MAVSDEGYQHIEHGFEPVFDQRSRVLVLGSFPSVLSRANAFYYGNPQNRFWRVMAACLGVPVPPNEGDPLVSGEPATLRARATRASATLCRHISSALPMPRRSRSLSVTAVRQGDSTNATCKIGRGCPPSSCPRQVLPMPPGAWSGLLSGGAAPLIGRLFRFSSLSARQDAS